jgi:integrase
MTAPTTAPRRRNRRIVFDDATVGGLKRGRKEARIPDPLCPPNHYLRIPPAGSSAAVSYIVVARNPLGKQIWHTFGNANTMGIEQARERCKEIAAKIKAGEPLQAPQPVKPDSVADVCANWLKRYVKPRKLRTAKDIERLIQIYILPHLGDRPFTSIRKSDTATLGDIIEDRHGARTADRVLGTLRSICLWYSERAPDDYVLPFALRTAKRDVNGGPRERVLTDDEIKRLWHASFSEASFGAFCRFALLCGQRKSLICDMRWNDVDSDGVWTVRDQGARAKGHITKVKLPPLALSILRDQPRIAGKDFIFASVHGRDVFSNFTRCQHRLSKQANVHGWTPHDLRRTARTLLARCGVERDIAEQVLGHAIPGVEGTYNRFDYTPQKSAALDRLANLVAEIVGLPADAKVVKLKRPRKITRV